MFFADFVSRKTFTLQVLEESRPMAFWNYFHDRTTEHFAQNCVQDWTQPGFPDFWFSVLVISCFFHVDKWNIDSFEEYCIGKYALGVSMKLRIFNMPFKLKIIHFDYKASSSFAEIGVENAVSFALWSISCWSPYSSPWKRSLISADFGWIPYLPTCKNAVNVELKFWL